jgi:hypothetical protein
MPEQDVFRMPVAQVRQRSGAWEPFRLEALERSVEIAFRSVQKSDDFAMRAVAEAAYLALAEQVDEKGRVTIEQVKDAVAEALAKNGLMDVRTAYLEGRAPIPPMRTQNAVAPARSHSSPPVPMTVGETYTARRRRLNEERKAITHKFQVGAHEGYITVGLYDDGQPGEIFLKMSKEGSMMSGLMDAFATAVSIGLQYGVPLKVLVNKFAQSRFEPNGATQNPNIPVATSIMDYIFRWLALKFLTPEERQALYADESSFESPLGLSLDASRQSNLLGSEPAA